MWRATEIAFSETKSHLAELPEAVVRWETETGEFPEAHGHGPGGLLYQAMNKTVSQARRKQRTFMLHHGTCNYLYEERPTADPQTVLLD